VSRESRSPARDCPSTTGPPSRARTAARRRPGKESVAKTTEPLRGEAAFLAAKKAVSARNEAAYARGRDERQKRNTEAIARQAAEERRMAADMPSARR
jgi:hypothetical protein